jgi:hypothetical protein
MPPFEKEGGEGDTKAGGPSGPPLSLQIPSWTPSISHEFSLP